MNYIFLICYSAVLLSNVHGIETFYLTVLVNRWKRFSKTSRMS